MGTIASFYFFGIVTNTMLHFEGIAGIQDYKIAGPITISISDAYGRSIYKYIDWKVLNGHAITRGNH